MARIFITGSSDGLGLLAAKTLVSEGHRVVLHARNEERADDVMREVPAGESILTGDMSSMEETRKLAVQVNELGRFNAIIHNAGIYNVPGRAKSPDGLPLLFAVNSLAPYILTAMIHRPERLIYLSSGLHRHGDAREERLDSILEGRHFPGYPDTKLHDLLLALAVARHWKDVSSNAVDPGWVPTKMGGRNAPGDLEEGFATQVWLAVGQDTGAKLSGRYLYHKMERDFHPQAGEREIQDRFMWVCERITGIPFPGSRPG